MNREEFEKLCIAHINRPLDINEILSREDCKNVVVDAYEYILRKVQTDSNCKLNDIVNNFFLSVGYDGYIGNGGISVFFEYEEDPEVWEKTADALHSIGAYESETLLRKAIKNQTADFDIESYNLDIESYYLDIHSYLYKYLQDNKNYFLEI